MRICFTSLLAAGGGRRYSAKLSGAGRSGRGALTYLPMVPHGTSALQPENTSPTPAQIADKGLFVQLFVERDFAGSIKLINFFIKINIVN